MAPTPKPKKPKDKPSVSVDVVDAPKSGGGGGGNQAPKGGADRFGNRPPNPSDPNFLHKAVAQKIEQNKTGIFAGPSAAGNMSQEERDRRDLAEELMPQDPLRPGQTMQGAVLPGMAAQDAAGQRNVFAFPETTEGSTTLTDEITAERRAQFQQGEAPGIIDMATDFSKIAFQLYDNLRALTTIGGKDVARVKEARETFNKANAEFEKEIKKIRAGGGNPNVAISNLKRSVIAVNAIESHAHKKGLHNLVYWLRDGKELETEIAINNDELLRLHEELLQAVEEGKINAAKMRLGIQ